MQVVLEEALEDYRRKELINETNKAYALLRKDKKAWKEELEERKLWECTLMDGLEDDEKVDLLIK